MQTTIVRISAMTLCALSLAACGGSSSTGAENDPAAQDEEALRRWHRTHPDAGSTSPTTTTDTGSTATPPSSGSTTPKYVTSELTFYGWPDNDPAGAGIALPTIHSQAGGTGTYADPVTFASAPSEYPKGTILYVPFLKKYVIMEDTCAACTSDWSSGKRHIDVWMNSDATNGAKLLSCQYAWTRPSIDVEVSPPPDRPVDPTPIFQPKTGVCLTP